LKRISESLSSLTLTAWLLAILFLWLGSGILLAGSEAFRNGFEQMNANLIRHWLATPENGNMLLKFWFVGLCLVMTVMGVNLIFCSWTKIFKIIRIRFNGKKLFMLIVHMVFGFVALSHFGGFMLGFKHDKIRLNETQQFHFQQEYDLKLADVHFIDDHNVLKKSRWEITRDEFHYRENYAQVILYKNGKELKRGKIYLLQPMCYEDIRITLKKFLAPRFGDTSNPGESKPAVMLVVSKNPVLEIFLILYPVMVLGIFVYLLMTWNVKSVNNPS
jgi:hypothetical protein